MAGLPKLSDSRERKLHLQWGALAHSYDFSPEHLKLPDARGRNGEHTSISDGLVARTSLLAKERFDQIAGEYLELWVFTQNPQTEMFEAWLGDIKTNVMSEIADVWSKSERHPSFQDRCLRMADEKLASLRATWLSRARSLEIRHLDNPYLSFASLAGYATASEVPGKAQVENTEFPNPASPVLVTASGSPPAAATAGGEPAKADPTQLSQLPAQVPDLDRDRPNWADQDEAEANAETKAAADLGTVDRTKLSNQRRAHAEAWKEARKKLGRPFSDEDIAKLAKPGKWNDRTPVARWKLADPRSDDQDDKAIRAILDNPDLTN